MWLLVCLWIVCLYVPTLWWTVDLSRMYPASGSMSAGIDSSRQPDEIMNALKCLANIILILFCHIGWRWFLRTICWLVSSILKSSQVFPTLLRWCWVELFRQFLDQLVFPPLNFLYCFHSLPHLHHLFSLCWLEVLSLTLAVPRLFSFSTSPVPSIRTCTSWSRFLQTERVVGGGESLCSSPNPHIWKPSSLLLFAKLSPPFSPSTV